MTTRVHLQNGNPWDVVVDVRLGNSGWDDAQEYGSQTVRSASEWVIVSDESNVCFKERTEDGDWGEPIEQAVVEGDDVDINVPL